MDSIRFGLLSNTHVHVNMCQENQLLKKLTLLQSIQLAFYKFQSLCVYMYTRKRIKLIGIVVQWIFFKWKGVTEYFHLHPRTTVILALATGKNINYDNFYLRIKPSPFRVILTTCDACKWMECWMDLGLQCNDLRCIHYRKMFKSCLLIKLIWNFLIKI